MASRTHTTMAVMVGRLKSVVPDKLKLDWLPFRYQFGILFFIFLFLLPTGLTVTQLYPIIGIMYLMMFAMSWDVASGYTGYLNLGHTVFIAIGGYTSAVLNVDYALSPVLSIPIAVVMAALGGLLIGLPALRIRGPYLALLTLIAPLIMIQFTVLFSEVLRGRQGFGIAPDFFVGSTTGSVITVENQVIDAVLNYYLAFFAMVLVFVFLYAVTRTDSGKVFTAIREDEETVVAAGFNPAKYKLFAFVISAATAGFAGALFVHSPVGHPQPAEILNLQLSLNVVIMAAIGGIGTIVGSLVGAFLFGIFDFLVSQSSFSIPLIGKTLQGVMPLPLLVIGFGILIYAPRGIVPTLLQWGRQVNTEETEDDAVVADGGRPPLEQIRDKFNKEMDQIINGRNNER